MKVYSTVAFETFGTLTMEGDGVKMEIKLEAAELLRLNELARSIFLERQVKLATVVATPPAALLAAPEPEGEEAEFTPVDDIPF